MLKQLITPIVLSFAALLTLQSAGAQGTERSGKEVVEATCIACHGTGEHGAAIIGDEKAWAELASQGLRSLTQSALEGIREMPAHGGKPDLTDLEIERAITYMVNQSGGRWTEPISGITRAVERKGGQIVRAQCAACHATGEAGAPRIGDVDAWIPRFKKGLDFVVRSAIHGHGPMPPRGDMADLTDPEIRAAILYMYYPVEFPTERPEIAPITEPDPYHKVVEGTEIYLGVVAAETISAQYPKDSEEASMHGGVPRGRDYYHLNVSLFDARTRTLVTDAQVQMTVSELGFPAVTKQLELMAFDNMQSYGHYFRMPRKNPYAAKVQIRRPGVPRTIEARFEFKPD